jgi:hypothetical protein
MAWTDATTDGMPLRCQLAFNIVALCFQPPPLCVDCCQLKLAALARLASVVFQRVQSKAERCHF